MRAADPTMTAAATNAERCALCLQTSSAPSPVNASGTRPEVVAEVDPAGLAPLCQLIDDHVEALNGVPGS